MINLNIQILILIYSFLSGIIFGFSFDIYRAIIWESQNKIIKFIKDAIFWVVVGIGVFCFLLYTQYAILSFYTYFYIFLGIIFYLKIISCFIFLKIKKAVYIFLSIFRIVFKNTFYIFSNILFRIFNIDIKKN